MSKLMKLGIIGAGNMAEAFLQGLVNSSHDMSLISVYDLVPDRLAYFREKFGVKTLSDNLSLARSSDALVLLVKPQNAKGVLKELSTVSFSGKILISMVAGVSTADIEKFLPKAKVVRVVPNLAVAVGEGVCVVSPGKNVSSDDMAYVTSLLGKVGMVIETVEEHMDAVTGLSGSGPLYAALVVEALTDAGVMTGLPRDIAHKLSLQTILGTADLLRKTGEHPTMLRERVTSPGGAAIEAFAVLEREGVRANFMEAVRAASRKTHELRQYIKNSME